jgi:hypothetical protein
MTANQPKNNNYLGAVHRGVVLHVLLHGQADLGGGQLAVGVAQLVQFCGGDKSSR